MLYIYISGDHALLPAGVAHVAEKHEGVEGDAPTYR